MSERAQVIFINELTQGTQNAIWSCINIILQQSLDLTQSGAAANTTLY